MSEKTPSSGEPQTATDVLVKALRDTRNWRREMPGSWKDCVLQLDRTPFEAADALEAKEAELATLHQDKLVSEASERHIRRLLCSYASGPGAYRDDGEASDSSTHPGIDFLRDSAEEIEQKLRERVTVPKTKVLLEHSGCGHGPQVDQISITLHPGDKVMLVMGRYSTALALAAEKSTSIF